MKYLLISLLFLAQASFASSSTYHKQPSTINQAETLLPQSVNLRQGVIATKSDAPSSPSLSKLNMQFTF